MYRKETQFEPQTESTQQQQKINIPYIIEQQLIKISSSGWKGDEAGYSNAIQTLLKDLPIENQKHIESRKDEYITRVEKPEWKYCSGRKMGTLENPLFCNRKGVDWRWSADINNGQPIRISPIIEEVEETNYQTLYGLIMEEMQSMGLLFKIEPHDRVGKKIKYPPTPLITLKDGSEVRVLMQKDVPPEIALLQKQANSNETDEDNSTEEYEDSEEMDLDEDVQ